MTSVMSSTAGVPCAKAESAASILSRMPRGRAVEVLPDDLLKPQRAELLARRVLRLGHAVGVGDEHVAGAELRAPLAVVEVGEDAEREAARAQVLERPRIVRDDAAGCARR